MHFSGINVKFFFKFCIKIFFTLTEFSGVPFKCCSQGERTLVPAGSSQPTLTTESSVPFLHPLYRGAD